MSMTIHVNVTSAEAELYSGAANMVFAPAVMGEIGIAPRHAPLVTPLKAGDIRIHLDDKVEEHVFISGGIMEIQPHVVTILADTAVRAHDLDEAAAQEAKRRAEEMLEGQAADMDYAKAQAELAEAVAQLQTIQKLRKIR